MPSPILFFIFIIAIDLILKSSKDKKKVDAERQKRVKELQNQPSTRRPIQDLRKILDEELERERQREASRRQAKSKQPQISKSGVRRQKENIVEKNKINEDINWGIKPSMNKVQEEPKLATNQIKGEGANLKRDILMGIVFSEILSEPKSIQNQRRSL